MRTTVNLDEDAYSFAQAYAAGKGISFSAALSELVRRAERVPAYEEISTRIRTGPHGYPVIAETGYAITPEMVKEAAEDEIL